VLLEQPPDALRKKLEMAASVCPRQAIRLVKD
jgi:ferredoxin